MQRLNNDLVYKPSTQPTAERVINSLDECWRFGRCIGLYIPITLCAPGNIPTMNCDLRFAIRTMLRGNLRYHGSVAAGVQHTRCLHQDVILVAEVSTPPSQRSANPHLPSKHDLSERFFANKTRALNNAIARNKSPIMARAFIAPMEAIWAAQRPASAAAREGHAGGRDAVGHRTEMKNRRDRAVGCTLCWAA